MNMTEEYTNLFMNRIEHITIKRDLAIRAAHEESDLALKEAKDSYLMNMLRLQQEGQKRSAGGRIPPTGEEEGK